MKGLMESVELCPTSYEHVGAVAAAVQVLGEAVRAWNAADEPTDVALLKVAPLDQDLLAMLVV